MDALERLTPLAPEYALRPVAEAFDWTEAGAALGEGEWYMVAFRSIRRHDADERVLADYDERAHQEAATAPGFVHYFKGPLGADRSCLSFCIWASRAHAREAAGRPLHAEAAGLVADMYESYTLEFLRLRRSAEGPLTFEPYDGPLAAVTPEPSTPLGALLPDPV